MQKAKRKIYTVSIYDMLDEDMDIWTASFTSRKKAESFMEAVEEKLSGYELDETVKVTFDSGVPNEDDYLGWIDDRYGEE